MVTIAYAYTHLTINTIIYILRAFLTDTLKYIFGQNREYYYWRKKKITKDELPTGTLLLFKIIHDAKVPGM